MKLIYQDNVIVTRGFHKGRIGIVMDYDLLFGYLVTFNQFGCERFRYWSLKKVEQK